MKFICFDFADFATYGRIPRNPPQSDLPITSPSQLDENVHHALPVYDVETIDYSTSILIFISHAWLSAASPDNDHHDKHRLIIEGVNKARNSLAKDCKVYLWIDYSCIDQDEGVSSDLISLEPLMRHVDLLFTPILAQGELVEHYNDYCEGYHAEGWDSGERAYLSRAWCRTEMFYASSTLKQHDSHRVLQFRAGLKAYASMGRGRSIDLWFILHFADHSHLVPHLLYGQRESSLNSFPLMLPPMPRSYFKRFHPLEGQHLPKDEMIMRGLVENLHPILTTFDIGWQGPVNSKGAKHGYGVHFDPNGEVYLGEFKDDLKEGQGTLIYPSGSAYIGTFHCDQRAGLGAYSNINGNEYEGEYLSDKKHGQGLFKYANGDVYEGQYEGGKRHGTGTFTSVGKKYSYIGEWCQGSKHGHGKLTLHDGSTYEGQFRNDQKDGVGTYKYSNGNEYKGEFRKDKKEGRGTFKYTNGNEYVGCFKDDKKEGQGIFSYSRGSKYVGSFKNDLKEGEGVDTYVDGNEYAGGFKKDMKHGQGLLKYADGDVYKGEFKNNFIDGQGAFNGADGHRYIGGFKNGKRCGQGKLIFPNGDSYEGDFKNGKMNGNGMYVYSNGKQVVGVCVDDECVTRSTEPTERSCCRLN